MRQLDKRLGAPNRLAADERYVKTELKRGAQAWSAAIP
jgi:hypothetical protein